MPPEAEAPAAPAPAPAMDDMASLTAAISQDIQRPAAPKQPEAAPTPKPKDQPAPKEPAASKKPWEVQVQDPDAEPTPEPAPAQEQEPADMKPEAKTRWKDLRATETKYKELQPQFEALKAELEALRNAPKEAPDDVKAELETLRNFRAAYDVVNTPEYVEAVAKPYQDATRRLQEVAAFAKVDFNKLFETSGEDNRLVRNKMIRSIIMASEEEGVDEAVIAEATTAINDMLPLFAKDQELRAKAGEIRTAIEGRKTQETEAQRQQHEATLAKASKEMDDLLMPKFKAFKLFEDAEFAKRVSEARVADPTSAPMDAVFQAKAGVLLPKVVEKYNAMATELRDLRKTLNARNNSSPTTTSTAASTNHEAPRSLSDTETLASMQAAARMPFTR